MMHATGDAEVTPGMITATGEAEVLSAMTPATGDKAPPVMSLLPVTQKSY